MAFALAGWLGLCAAAFVALLFVSPPPQRLWPLLLLGLAAAIIRLVPIALFPEGHGLFLIDIRNYQETADAVLDRRDVYELPARVHPYPPLQMYVFALASLCADALPISFFAAVRIPQALADAGTAVLIVLSGRRLAGDAAGWRAGLLYAVCPLPLVVTVYHGQFDAISVFFAVGALAALLYGKERPSLLVLSAVLLGLGMLQKVWPVLLLPVLLMQLPDGRARLSYIGVAAAAVALGVMAYVLAFDSTPMRVYDAVADYRAPTARATGLLLVLDESFGGLRSVDRFITWYTAHGRWVMGALVGAMTLLVLVRRTPVAEACVIVLVSLFVLSSDAVSYHFLWLLPFGLLAGQRLPVGAVVLLAVAGYAITGFLGGAMYFPGPGGPIADWLLDRRILLAMLLWFAFVGWYVSLAAGLLQPEREGPQAASAPGADGAVELDSRSTRRRSTS
jgi:hypothetical protein